MNEPDADGKDKLLDDYLLAQPDNNGFTGSQNLMNNNFANLD